MDLNLERLKNETGSYWLEATGELIKDAVIWIIVSVYGVYRLGSILVSYVISLFKKPQNDQQNQ